MRDLRVSPIECRRRGLPAIAVRLSVPESLEVVTPPADGAVVACVREPGAGELAVEMFAAGLIIDRDRVLEDLADDHARLTPGKTARIVPVELEGGASGFLAEIDSTGELPCVSVYVLAPPDLAVCGGAVVTIRSAVPEWPAAADMLASLRLGARDLPANDARGMLPVVGRRR